MNGFPNQEIMTYACDFSTYRIVVVTGAIVEGGGAITNAQKVIESKCVGYSTGSCKRSHAEEVNQAVLHGRIIHCPPHKPPGFRPAFVQELHGTHLHWSSNKGPATDVLDCIRPDASRKSSNHFPLDKESIVRFLPKGVKTHYLLVLIGTVLPSG
jgi:hypothetical protein